MPFQGGTLDTGAIAVDNITVSWTGTNLGENQSPSSAARVYDGTSWTNLTISTWGNLSGSAIAAAALSAGTYRLEVTTSDNDVLTLNDAFVIAGASGGVAQLYEAVYQF